MRRALIVLATLLVSSSAFAQDPSQEVPVQPVAPAPAYGSARSEQMKVRVNPFIGFMLGGAKPFGDFGNAFNFGPEITIRGGADIIIGPGVSIAPDGELRFGRFGSVTALDQQGISSALFFGLMFGGRFGFEVANLVTPYFDLHLGYFHNQATGDACNDPNLSCGSDKFGMEFGFGAEFWLTETVGLGPFMKFNFDFTDTVSSQWFSFGPSLTLRL